MNSSATIDFDNSYFRLGKRFGTPQAPSPVTAPQLIRINHALADFLTIDTGLLQSTAGLNSLAGNTLFDGSQPIASVYAGHQFGNWNPQLGDGRAILLGEVIANNQQRYDIQLKGSGETAYSRNGDGRSPLGPVLREYIVSEAMAVLGIATTRSLAAVTTGETVYRDKGLPGAILTRVASSHIRVGTFQFFSSQGDDEAVKILADHVIKRHFSSALNSKNPYLNLLEQVIDRQAQLIAQWQAVGFIHGVMNTDNMLICGETIDYGPCAFLDQFDPSKVFSSIDRQGRYAYKNQPLIGQWNTAWFAQSLLPLLDADEDTAIRLVQPLIENFIEKFTGYYHQHMAKKLGLTSVSESFPSLLSSLLSIMHEEQLDYTLTLRYLSDCADPTINPTKGVAKLIDAPAALTTWIADWQQQLPLGSRSAIQQQMYACNPVIIPRNHQIEAAINAATYQQDFSLFNQLVDALQSPFDYNQDVAHLAQAPAPEQRVRATFCGT